MSNIAIPTSQAQVVCLGQIKYWGLKDDMLVQVILGIPDLAQEAGDVYKDLGVINIYNINNYMSGRMTRIVNIEYDDSGESKQMYHEFKCDQCQFVCSEEAILRNHIKTKHEKTVVQQKRNTSKLNCSHCDEKVNTNEEM